MSEPSSNGPTRRQLTTYLAALTAAGATTAMAPNAARAQSGAPAAPQAGAASSATAGAPFVVPALREWQGQDGKFTVDQHTRVTVPSGDQRLLQLARTLTDELTELTGVRLRPPRVTDAATDDHQIRLQLTPDDRHSEGGDRFREEGGRIVVRPRYVRISGPAYAGVYYGTRSLLQILVGSDDCTVPAGTVADWPAYRQRGFMLDVGRRFFTPEFLRDYIRVLSWFKFNDFQIHLNDNEIQAPDGDWSKAYSAFRLASDHPKWSGLAAEDGSYDRATWDSFEELGAACAVRITPEIDAPAHSRPFVAFRPDIGLHDGNSDHLDLANPEATAFMRDLFDEFVPWFRSPVVHYGADEYEGPVEQYQAYFNEIAEHLRGLGKRPAAWGSLSQMGGSAKGFDREVLMYSWNNGWYGPHALKKDGFRFVNINDVQQYIVPFADYYNGNGLDSRFLYDSWAPHVFPDEQSLAPLDPDLNGAMFAVWNDLVHEDYTELDVHGLVNKTLGILSQKCWAAERADGHDHDQFQRAVRKLGLGPGLRVLR